MFAWNKHLLAGLVFCSLALGCTKVVTMPAPAEGMRSPVAPKGQKKEMPKPPPPPLPPP